MKVKRIVTDVYAPDPEKADQFYKDIFGLDLLMDLSWIRTYGNDVKMSVQISIAREGGSGTPTPDSSIEVDDLDIALDRANIPIKYGPVVEPWGVRRFFIRDPFGKLIDSPGNPGVLT